MSYACQQAPSHPIELASSSITPARNSMESPVMNNMKRSMTDELEQRRLAWEQDVAKLQQDFFKTKLGDGTAINDHRPGQQYSTTQDSSNGGKIQAFKPSIAASADDVYRQRFNLSGYAPEEISVRAEGYVLIVAAKHLEGEESHRRVTRNFNKQVDIPDNVQLEKLISYLSKDGTLTVEAPWSSQSVQKTSHTSMTPPTNQSNRVKAGNVPVEHIQGHYQSSTPGISFPTDRMNHVPSAQQLHSSSPSYQTSSTVTNLPSFSTVTGSPFVFDTEYGRMLKLHVDLGRTDYRPDEVKVIVGRSKISVTALHEEVKNGRTTRREFKREFEIPESIEMSTLQAVLDVKTGQVFIGASFVTNMKHSMVSYLITQHMPLFGRPCVIEKY